MSTWYFLRAIIARLFAELGHVRKAQKYGNWKPRSSVSAAPAIVRSRPEWLCAFPRISPSGLSNKEIARNLGIAPETVKSHVKSIFVKLAVDKRAHAVARAQALGLLRDR
jgi:DNA-binding NarL/FixJ family response regulator